MALKYDVDTLDEVPEKFRELYKEVEGGKFRLDAEDGKATKALAEERKARREAEKKLAAFNGVTPEDIEKAKAELDEFKMKAAAGIDTSTLTEEQRKALFGRELADCKKLWEQSHSAEIVKRDTAIKEKDAAIAKLRGEYYGEKLETTVNAIAGDRIVATARKDLMRYAKAELHWSDDDGDFVDGHGLAVKDWVEGAIAENPHWLPPSLSGHAMGGIGGKINVSVPQSPADVIRMCK